MSAGPPAPDYVDFGRFLKAQRVRRGLSVDEVARSTKISPALVDALEEGLSERLPERVFMLNYIKSYAVVVGLEPAEAVSRFEAIPEAPREEAFDPPSLEKARRERAWLTLRVLFATLCTGAFALALKAMYELALRYANR
ncbi:MAG: helix-turn-helix domain-containing protein [Myxococcales bacterium]|nr:helix-turn-helix domain-containing protein [Myxococcales bacterium]